MADKLTWTNVEWATKIDGIYERTKQQPFAGRSVSNDLTPAQLALHMDHTLLKLDATEEQIDKLCNEAREHGFKTVCVRLDWVARCVKNLQGTSTEIACVVGFHEGTYSTAEKIGEQEQAIRAGAKELDVVINHPLLQPENPDYAEIYSELFAIKEAAGKFPSSPTLKIILETSQLNPQQIAAASIIAYYAGFDFIKTSTGFLGRGSSVEDVQLMKTICDYMASYDSRNFVMLVKASGGIRDLKTAKAMIDIGADRLGVSAGVPIVAEARGLSTAAEEKASGY